MRQRRSDSGAIPGSFATAEIAFVSDEYEERDSASSPTAFALNSGAYRAPFAMVPSSPIESEEIRNKNQFISAEIERRTGLTATLNHYRRTLTTLDNVDDFNPATFHALCQRIEITPNGKATVIWKDGTNPPEQ